MRLPWRRETQEQWSERWEREHRWDALADYNARVSKGIVHTPEYVAMMRDVQRRFDDEVNDGRYTGFPITLEPER